MCTIIKTQRIPQETSTSTLKDESFNSSFATNVFNSQVVYSYRYKSLNECQTCESRFTQKAELNRHDMIHSGEKPYKCISCEKQFPTKGDVPKHEFTHSSGNKIEV